MAYITEINAIVCDYYLKWEFIDGSNSTARDASRDYLRLNTFITSHFLSAEKKNIESLTQEGNNMWNENKDAIKKFIQDTLDDRYGDH